MENEKNGVQKENEERVQVIFIKNIIICLGVE